MLRLLDPLAFGNAGAKVVAEALKVNRSVHTIAINNKELDLSTFKDGKTTELDLQNRGYQAQEAIIIAALLAVCT